MGTRPLMIWPVEPSMVTTSPLCRSTPPACSVSRSRSMETVEAPTTQGRPMPRATTAAWLVMPPRVVRTPTAACMPCTSSGEVSTRARITVCPCALRCTASSASKTSSPEAAPGEAGSPLARTILSALGSSVGCKSWSSWAALMLLTASSRPIRPSSAMSTAIFRAACVERLPARVCSRKSLPSCTVNSMSWMSRKCASSLAQAAASSANTSGISPSSEGLLEPDTHRAASVKGCGVRMPATTSSPWALTRNSP